MEHFIVLIIHFVLWLDKKSLKPAQASIPEFAQLVNDPTPVLARQEIVIGPSRRLASSLSLGLVLAIPVWGILVAAYLAVIGQGNAVPLTRGDKLVLLALFLAALYLLSLLMMRLRRGGTLVLHAEGVDFCHRDTLVRCPWALFNMSGVPFFPREDQMLLPIVTAAVPYVEMYRGEDLVSEGMKVNSRAFRLPSPHLAEVRAFYEIQPADVGNLLLSVARRIEAPLPLGEAKGLEEVVSIEPVPRLVRRPDGRIDVSLNHLVFPPFCCECGCAGAPQRPIAVNQYALKIRGYPLLEMGQSTPLAIPVCNECWKAYRRWTRLMVLWSILPAIGLSVLVMVLGACLPDPWNILVIGAALGLWVLVPLLVYQFAVVRARPFHAMSYRPTSATVTLIFRQRRYADALVELHHGRDELLEEVESAEMGFEREA